MKLKVFTVLDSQVGAYLPPFFCRSKGEALRSFADAVNEPKHQFSQHSLDYSLYEMGEYDDASGLFDCDHPRYVIGAMELRSDEPVEAFGRGVAGATTSAS